VAFDTPEYRRSTAAVASGAIEAWNRGWSGAGVTVATLDSGIDLDSAEFAGRVHPASRDVTGAGRSIDDPRGHGTAVAAIIGAARDGAGIVGLAPDVRLAVLRADSAGSCEGAGCRFSDGAMAAGLDAAVSAGARAINISLGGSPAGGALRGAIDRATRAGIILIISAGNDAQASVDPLPQSFLSAGDPRLVIVAGGAAADGSLADFSNRAGGAAANYLVAIAERVRSIDHQGTALLYSGTSFATPQVTGAVALLAHAFPTLTGAQIVDLLLRTARDAGAPGTDPEYGRGLLDLARAFQPVGGTSVAGGAVSLSSNGSLGTALGGGDAFGSALTAVPITDGYGRRYAASLGHSIRPAAQGRLVGALAGAPLEMHDLAGAIGEARLALTVRVAGHASRNGNAGDAHLGLAHRGVDAHAALRHPVHETRVSLRSGALELAAATGPAAAAILPGAGAGGLLAPDGLEPEPDAARSGRRLAMAGATIGPLSLAMAAGGGQRALAPTPGLATVSREDRLTLAAALPLGRWTAAVRATTLAERGGFLGTRLSAGFGLGGGDSLFAGAALAGPLPCGFDFRLAATGGWHRLRLQPGLIADADGLRSTGWSVALGAPLASGRLMLHHAQPLAITGGTLRLSADGEFGAAANLAVSRPERITEARWSDRSGTLSLTAYHRDNPGHRFGPPDRGAALTIGRNF
jgi:hypothetical protein